MAEPVGRPSSYDPRYCDEIIEYMSDGSHLYEFAAHIGVCRHTLNDWAIQHPEFSTAKKIAQSKQVSAWLSRARAKAFGVSDKGSDTLMIYMLKCIAREEFGDTQRVESVNTNNNFNTNLDIDRTKLTPEQARLLRNALADGTDGD